MPFCPNCRTEFEFGTQCSDCGAQLVAALPSGWATGQNPEATKPAELCELTDGVQLELIEHELRAAGIPSVRRPRSIALFVPQAWLARAQRIMAGEQLDAAGEESTTVSLSELHRLHLVCSECGTERTVDLLTERVPAACGCGHLFDLSEAAVVLDRYTEVVRMMANADYEIELEKPHEGAE
jgi:hypothetical protein